MFVKLVLVAVSAITIVLIGPSRAQTDIDVESFGKCYTPNREQGLCIYLKQCGELYNLLQKNPLTNDERQFLHNSQCGYFNKNVLVCCPSRSIMVNRQTTTKPTRPSIPVRNSGLLPNPPVCGSYLSDRIYGGNITKIDEFPWMALLQYTKPGNSKGFHCGGSLINSRYVITAAHCAHERKLPQSWSLSTVRLGEWDLATDRDCELDDCSDPVQDIPIERTIIHKEYDPNSKGQLNDIALLRLSREVKYSDWIKPVCLPTAPHLRNANYEGTALDVAGWGNTEHGSASNVKLKARVDGVDLRDCNDVYKTHRIILRDSQLCAGGEKGIDSCRGDSGGPLVGLESGRIPYYYLAGVVSFGPTPCGLEGWPGVYTKVGNYIDWIESNVLP